MLRLHAGEFGRWQLRHFVLTCLAWALEAMHTMVMIFADRGGEAAGARTPRRGPAAAAGGRRWAEWGLVCGERYKVGLVQAGFFAGCMIGAGVFGHLSDSFLGRKGSLTIVCVLNTVFGLLTSLSPSYWAYAALRLLTGFSTGGVGLCAFVLATEPVGPAKRGAVGMSTFYFFSAGIALLSGVAYLFPPWRHLYVVSSLPSLLFLVSVLPFLSESPRWYLVRRRPHDAMAVMREIARTNGRRLPDNVSLKLDDDDEEHDKKEDQNSYSGAALSGSILDVVRSPTTRVRLVLTVAINLLCSVVYYGINLNVVNLKTNLYLSVLLNSVAGIFGMAATYNLLFIYTMELFPTVVRNAALGCATQAAQMGAILAPLVVVLGRRCRLRCSGRAGSSGGCWRSTSRRR
ncbi:organic cation/carnitine transporter 4 [Iris pallida]|uniref:H(+)/Pi cotransporter n=1 Tax=Iris pallida TaxID=29817 RepID=A0AAX6IJA9_IRIPA|nr:organic cation/carnitine transporter 4 [Iris pallida]